MTIERTANEFIIRLPLSINVERMQDIVDYLRYKELTADFNVPQSEVDTLSQTINRDWWQQNRANCRFT